MTLAILLALLSAASALADSTPLCTDMPTSLFTCLTNTSCVYGLDTTAECTVPTLFACDGQRTFNVTFNCRFCYQTPDSAHSCLPLTSCDATKSELTYPTNCTVNNATVCLGNRFFTKNVQCNWTSGLRQDIAFMYSIFLGGFGADRFYLGYTGWGIFKLFSLGGFGVWCLIDLLLIGLGYLGPADGSVYFSVS